MYFIKTPSWLKRLYSSSLTWKIATGKKEIFLTFDDGPHPSITPFVLDCLKQYNAKATFFLIGKNVQLHADVVQQILSDGHKIGNHTHNHLNGWKTDNVEYFNNIFLAKKYINSNLFRPPYGRISWKQIKKVKTSFEIIMWDVLSGDFDESLSPRDCLRNVLTKTTNGSIIVFHDSEKAFARLQYALPETLKYFTEKGYQMKAIDNDE